MTAPRLALLASLLVALFATPLRAGEADQAQMDILLDTVRANKRALIAVNLTLTDEEAGKFWPIYDRYQGELTPIGDRVAKLVDEYTKSFPKIPDDRAAALIGEYLDAEADRAQVRKKYLPEFSKALPGRKVARFYQIENKTDAVIRYDLASHIPVVEQ